MFEKRNLILVDRKIPEEAKEKLSDYGTVVGIFSEGLINSSISGHPDIFFCKTLHKLILAPNTPQKYFLILEENSIQYEIGNFSCGFPSPVADINNEIKKMHFSGFIHYNAAVSDKYLVHTLRYTDPVILQNSHYLKKIPVNQGYTRSNLLLLDKEQYISSDEGIARTLNRHGLEGLLVSPEGIILPGFQNGFIGGTMGVYGKKVFINGSLHLYKEGRKVRTYLESLSYEIIELYDGPLFDAGGILFI